MLNQNYGYRSPGEKKAEYFRLYAENYRHIFTKLIDRGLSYKEICIDLQARKINTSTGRKVWNIGSVASICKRLGLKSKYKEIKKQKRLNFAESLRPLVEELIIEKFTARQIAAELMWEGYPTLSGKKIWTQASVGYLFKILHLTKVDRLRPIIKKLIEKNYEKYEIADYLEYHNYSSKIVRPDWNESPIDALLRKLNF